MKRPPLLGLRHRGADVFDAGQYSVKRGEVGGGGVGDHLGQGRLAGAGRTIEDQAAQPVRLNRPPQEPAWAYNRFLANELIEGAGAHARGQGRVGIDPFGTGGLKQIVGRLASLGIAHHNKINLTRAISSLQPVS